MCFNSILTQISSDNTCSQRLHWAKQLSSQGSARIQGVYFQSDLSVMSEKTPDLIMAPEGVAYVPDVAKNSHSIVKEDLQNIRTLIKENESCDDDMHWFSVPGSIAEQLSVVSLTHDLVILSRTWFNGFDQVHLRDLLPDSNEPLGTPILILPEHVPENEFFKKPLAVWDNSTQAARALKSALPMVKQIGQIGLLCDFHGSDEYDIVALEEVASWLETHNIKVVSVNSTAGDKSLAASIETVVNENHHDLVISGAKQESLLRNMVYGNPTEQLLKHTAVPLLINN